MFFFENFDFDQKCLFVQKMVKKNEFFFYQKYFPYCVVLATSTDTARFCINITIACDFYLLF